MLFNKANAQQKKDLLYSLLLPKGPEEGSTIFEISVNKTGTFAFQNIIDFMSGDHVIPAVHNVAMKREDVKDINFVVLSESSTPVGERRAAEA